MREEEAGAIAAKHLISLQHRRLAHLAGPLGLDTASRRRDGFVSTASASGLDVLVEEAAFEERGGYEAMNRLLAADPPPTGVFISNINQAVGAMAGARHTGFTVPAHLSLVSYDDDPMAEFLEVPLTVIAMPLYELGLTAVDSLIDQIEGSPPRDVVVRTRPRLVIRGSSAPAPDAAVSGRPER
jgi:LacI family transcriptional regulator